MKSKENYLDTIFKFLWIATLLMSVKSIFVDTGFDNAYSAAMAYRHIKGDTMFDLMWEPHQTSIFFIELIMRLYKLVVPSFTGVVLFLQLCGTLLFSFISIPLYKIISGLTNKYVGSLSCIFFLALRVKQSPFPEYTNLQIAFSTLLFIFLIYYLNGRKNVIFLILAAASLCLEVLAYPSGIVSYISAVVILILWSERKLTDVLIFTSTCITIGLGYLLLFISRIGISGLIDAVNNIFLNDTHSTESWYSSYFQSIPVALLWIVVSVFVSFIVFFILKKIFKIPVTLPACLGFFITLTELLFLLSFNKKATEFECAIYILPILIIAISVPGYRHMNVSEKQVWASGMIISFSCFIATQLLTDLGLLTVLPFWLLGAVVSFIPIYRAKKEMLSLLIGLCACVILHRSLVVWGYGNKWGVNMTYEVENIVRQGPAAGIVCDYMTYYMTKENIKDHEIYIHEDDCFMIVDTWVFDPIEYLIPKGNIANPSVIDTPKFTEHTLDYFAENPQKMPTVIAVSCWYGQLKIDEDSFIMNWINDYYEPVAEGSYRRYYRLK